MIFLKNKLLIWQGGARGPRILDQPWAPQHGDPALPAIIACHMPDPPVTKIRIKGKIQLTPALTDFKGPTIFICYRQIFFIVKIKILKKLFKELKISFVIGGFLLLAGPLQRDLTVVSPLKCVKVGIQAILARHIPILYT